VVLQANLGFFTARISVAYFYNKTVIDRRIE
jgi:hypothetical protein